MRLETGTHAERGAVPSVMRTQPLRARSAVASPDEKATESQRRLRGQLVQGNAVHLQDTELLELVLSRVVPKQNGSVLADLLIKAFGDFNRVVAASPARLMSVIGVTVEVVAELKLVEGCAQRMARAKMMDRPVISSWQALLDYCHTVMAHRETEQFRILFLDRKNRLISDETLGQGTVDHVPVYPREILRRALELNATALILVHNHPSGDPTPSESDISMTRTIQVAAVALGISLHDHLIIGASSEVSFRAEGLL